MRLSSQICSAAAALAVAALGVSSSAQAPATPRPNVVLIITDDVGYADIGSYGAKDIKTPNIDSLAKAGVKMTHFYANGSSCTPTRSGAWPCSTQATSALSISN